MSLSGIDNPNKTINSYNKKNHDYKRKMNIIFVKLLIFYNLIHYLSCFFIEINE